jgi:hypothetical protein
MDTQSEWRRLSILVGQSQPIDLWLNRLIRNSAAPVVQYFGGRYKKYRALPAYKQEGILDSLEREGFIAFEEELFNSWIPSFKDYFQTVTFVQSLSKDLKLAFEPFAPREAMMIIAHAFPLILRTGLEHLMTELDNKRGKLRKQIKRKIYDTVSHIGDRIIRELERFYDYRSRREDYHLSQFGFLLPELLYFDIIQDSKGNLRHLKALAQQCDLDYRSVLAFGIQHKLLSAPGR